MAESGIERALRDVRGGLLAAEMRTARAQLQEHVKSCRSCVEFGLLCPAAVKLFILWRGKAPAEDWILGGAAWLDGHPPGQPPEPAKPRNLPLRGTQLSLFADAEQGG